MMILVQRRISDSNVSMIEMKEFDKEALNEAKERFELYKLQDVISNCNFEDASWTITNESLVKRFNFKYSEIVFKKEVKTRELGAYENFINAVKAYLLYKLENNALSTVCGISASFEKFFNETHFLNIEYLDVVRNKRLCSYSYYTNLRYLLEFLEFIDFEVDKEYSELLNYQNDAYFTWIEQNRDLNQREITDFESMFKFDEIIESFWNTCSEQEKEEYFPIILWWKITTRIPLRVTEFVLTPYDCIRCTDDKYFIKLRRTRLKGERGKLISHKIEKDYRIEEYRINKEIYDLISSYKELVDKYDFIPSFYGEKSDCIGRRKFLLSRRAYFNSRKFKATSLRANNMYFFTVVNLKFLFYMFCKEIVCNRFNMQLVAKGTDTSEISNNQIEIIQLMDTRHFAFINLVLNDIEPLIIKKISGHKSVESSLHYYSHVEKFVKCYTYSMAKRIAVRSESNKDVSVIQSNVNFTDETHIKFNKIFGEDKVQFREIEEGMCSSQQQNYSDCQRVNNECEICEFYHPRNELSKQKVLSRIESNNNDIKLEVEALKTLLRQYKKVKNFNSEYGQKINHIKGLANENSMLIGKHII
jgi:hypothetical protein